MPCAQDKYYIWIIGHIYDDLALEGKFWFFLVCILGGFWPKMTIFYSTFKLNIITYLDIVYIYIVYILSSRYI